MSLKDYLAKDLEAFFSLNEFAQKVTYYLGAIPVDVDVQFFDQESDLGDSMMRKLVIKKADLPNLSKDGYFIINEVKYGVVDFMPDEENLIQQVILQREMK